MLDDLLAIILPLPILLRRQMSIMGDEYHLPQHPLVPRQNKPDRKHLPTHKRHFTPVYSYDFFGTLYDVRDKIPTAYLYVYGVGNIVLQALNVVWFYKMIISLRKRFLKEPAVNGNGNGKHVNGNGNHVNGTLGTLDPKKG
ncbi:hypothetical protein D9757_003610 [Collybiopsis confluens]|uniref:Uncharacterized protein n=1 Tax=Collybiopsis confluens TaxID=2823264 RepID=A0A8H5HUL1_9AGAR|nr:hypothetical protein D9757_003610 [Collybiopsis confluens]